MTDFCTHKLKLKFRTISGVWFRCADLYMENDGEKPTFRFARNTYKFNVSTAAKRLEFHYRFECGSLICSTVHTYFPIKQRWSAIGLVDLKQLKLSANLNSSNK